MDQLDEHFGRPLLVRPGKRIKELSPAGEQILRIASPLIPHFQLMWTNPELAAAPVLTIGTANTFEIHLLASRVISKWYRWLHANEKKTELIHLHVKEAESRFEGLKNVESGEWQVYLDCVREPTEASPDMEARSLNADLGLVVVVPTQLALAEDLQQMKKASGIKLQDLRDLPLCFVDVTGLGHRIAASGHRAARVALASNEAAKLIASQGEFATICAGWTKTLPHDYLNGEKYLVLPLTEPWSVHRFVAFVRTSPPPSKLVEEFLACVADALREEVGKKDIVGNPVGLLPVSTASRSKREKSRSIKGR